MHTIECQLHKNLNNIQEWATRNGFKFSKSKTVCMHFCQLRKAHDDPVLTLDGQPIPVVEKTKFFRCHFRQEAYIHTPYYKVKS